MSILHIIAHFFAGIFLANAIPHAVAGMLGRPFQSPFAKPSGEGLSSSTVNVVWGFFNAAVGYLLLTHVGSFEISSARSVLVPAVGAFLISLFAARHFGKFHGGNNPTG